MKYQAFESMVMKVVRDTIAQDSFKAEFFHGTLFLNTTKENMSLVYNELSAYTGTGTVQVTKITQGEYAVDFV
jgi:hypothetical protein